MAFLADELGLLRNGLAFLLDEPVLLGYKLVDGFNLRILAVDLREFMDHQGICLLQGCGGTSHVCLAAVPKPQQPRIGLVKLFGCVDVVVCAGGTGSPFFTTDTAAALKAIELRCDVLLKGTKVDGVYSEDPKKNPKAKRFETISHEEVIAKDLRVMDTAAFALARDNGLPIIVYALDDKAGLKGVLAGQAKSTRVG